MKVTRLANAEWATSNRARMRYVVVCNVHEGIDPDQPIRILDSLVAEQNRLAGWKVSGEEYIYVADLLSRLSEEARKHFLYG
ncbi:TPA_asm: hypothetical protein [ssRNA phage Zoerhiza.1_3]|uniref:Uncharacterized protein n=2 Tax=Leviviricetes TaxID=2842243 RepID=A0A8S5KZJ8_9VIRU|nr:hypothetical protein QIO25_gp4 [ssRNA phage Zoerhiza.1_3]QDH87932.1 MAG: hypothetical protein H1Rhizo25438_000004 [Leviviridae sp.]DAD50501.1 TPA_asm: hypothetical protein [ssRNA phage Zoerhiza.1_3]